MSKEVVIPDTRDIRATLDTPSAARCVLACPPHPDHGGHRGDQRLRAVSTRLGEAGIACLRFDYGNWDGGASVIQDAGQAVAWASDRFGRVAIMGYSFGGAVALLAARELDLAAVSVLAPAARLSSEVDATAAIGDLAMPVQVVVGTRDSTVEWEVIVESARKHDHTIVELPADHFFIGLEDRIATEMTPFLATQLDNTY